MSAQARSTSRAGCANAEPPAAKHSMGSTRLAKRIRRVLADMETTSFSTGDEAP